MSANISCQFCLCVFTDHLFHFFITFILILIFASMSDGFFIEKILYLLHYLIQNFASVLKTKIYVVMSKKYITSAYVISHCAIFMLSNLSKKKKTPAQLNIGCLFARAHFTPKISKSNHIYVKEQQLL